MFVSVPERARRSRFRLPPTACAAAVALAVAVAASLGQTRQSAQPPTTAPASPVATPVAPPPPPPQSSTSGPAATTDPAPAPPARPTLWELHEKARPVIYALDACSILALAIVFERLAALRRSRVIPPGFLPSLRAVYRDPSADRERALEYCRANDSPTARMVAAFVRRRPGGFAAAEKALEDAGGNEALRLRTNLRALYAIGSVATLLGLLGTIAGMIRAFMATAEAGEAANKVQLLSTGIYEAMVCTFGGLAVAILVTVFYYYFLGRIEKLITAINDELAAFADEKGTGAGATDGHG